MFAPSVSRRPARLWLLLLTIAVTVLGAAVLFPGRRLFALLGLLFGVLAVAGVLVVIAGFALAKDVE